MPVVFFLLIVSFFVLSRNDIIKLRLRSLLIGAGSECSAFWNP